MLHRPAPAATASLNVLPFGHTVRWPSALTDGIKFRRSYGDSSTNERSRLRIVVGWTLNVTANNRTHAIGSTRVVQSGQKMKILTVVITLL